MFPFPPEPVFPEGIDSDETLFLVYNTTESRLKEDNQPWASEIEIVAVRANQPEIWADNGFGTISGELFYYDGVEKDDNGKVKKLIRVGRNLGGSKTSFNKAGTMVRGFVIAEHHNQLVQAIGNIERFVGVNFTPLQETLDWRIRNLQELEVIFDDFSCPDIIFNFFVTENDPSTGVLAEYSIETSTIGGSFTTFRLDFGDGQFTTTDLAGTHRYSLNSNIDPVLTVTNDNCQIVLTPAERENPTEPPVSEPNNVEIPLPEIGDFPDFTIVPCETPDPELNIPQIVLPCTTVDSTTIPSVIIGPDINLVSNVNITGLDYPIILVSHVRIDGPDFPTILVSHISISPAIPSIVIIDPPIPSVIVIDNPISLIGIDWTGQPELGIDWSGQPELNVQVALTQPVRRTVKKPTVDAKILSELGDEYVNLFDDEETEVLEYEPVGIPEEIKLIAPNKEDLQIKLDAPEKILLEKAKDFPEDIKLKVPKGFGKDIKILGPENPLPDSINIVSDLKIPERISLVHDLPDVIQLEAPKSIKLDAPESIRVTGIPDSIEVMSNLPSIIQLVMPENPEIELVYKGGPIEMKVEMDTSALLSQDENGNNKQCFMLVPCNQ